MAEEWDGVIKGWLVNQFWAIWMYGDILKCYLDLMNNGVNMNDINRFVANEWYEIIKFGMLIKLWVVW